MVKAYPIILTPADKGYHVTVPDLNINTEGKDIPDSIFMARDAIGVWGICQQDLGNPIPAPSIVMPKHKDGEIAAFVDIDFDAYRRAQDNRTVRKNVTIPGWLNDMGEKAGVNFSQVLQEGLKEQLNVQNR